MAKPSSIKIRLNSTADTGFFYVTKKNNKTMTEKMQVRKYDPVAKKHVMFTDGYPYGSWGDENYCDTLFIVHGGHGDRSPEAPFGTTVPYTRDDQAN